MNSYDGPEFEADLKKKIIEEISRMTSRYSSEMKKMAADVPIEALCLKKKTQESLRIHGYLRIYDLLDVDLAKIEFLDRVEIRDLNSRFEQFFSML